MTLPNSSEFPSFTGYVSKDGRLFFLCHCGKTHKHGNGTGLRVSHGCELYKSYYLISPDDIKEGNK